jgi:hypothetical protein
VIGEPRRLQDGDRRPSIRTRSVLVAPLLREPQIYAKISDLKA